MKRLPAKYHFFVMPLFLSVIMSSIVSAIATVRVSGIHADTISVWLGAWFLSWIVAFPTLFVVMPIVRKLVGLVVDKE